MTAPTLRDARPEDVPVLRDLCRRSILELGSTAYGPAELEAWASFTLDEDRFRRFVLDHRTLVAEVGGTAAGFTGLGLRGHVVSLFVAPEFAGRGVSRILLEGLLRLGRLHGVGRFHAEASSVALPVFLRAGFRDQGPEEVVRDGVTLRRHRVILMPEVGG